MQAIRFKLSGKTAFFKKPDVNTYYYFTYGNIHKIALLGIMGSVMGLGGYNIQNQRKEITTYPDFYEKLKNSQIAIIPANSKGYITKKMQTFNNSVGYANKDGNLIVKEQWLQNPCWIVYVKIDENTKQFSDMILNKMAKFIPYLGKNDHFADIKDAKLVDVKEIANVNFVNSLFKSKDFKVIGKPDPDDYDYEEDIDPWKYQEQLPVRIDEKLNQYEFEEFTATNMLIKKDDEKVYVYKDEEIRKNICFF